MGILYRYSITFGGAILASGRMLAKSEAFCATRKQAWMLIDDLSAKSSILYECHEMHGIFDKQSVL